MNGVNRNISLKEKLLSQLLVIYIRYVLGGTFVFASIIKIKGMRFTGSNGESLPINTLWHFFETLYQSGIYWQFLGVGQFVAGALLMTQRFAKLGAILFLPIILNIFFITISYDFGLTPVITGMILITNLGLLFWDWNTIRFLINLPIVEDTPNRVEDHIIWELIGLVLLAFTSIYRILVDQYNVIFWLGGCLFIGAGGLIIWFRNNVNSKIVN